MEKNFALCRLCESQSIVQAIPAERSHILLSVSKRPKLIKFASEVSELLFITTDFVKQKRIHSETKQRTTVQQVIILSLSVSFRRITFSVTLIKVFDCFCLTLLMMSCFGIKVDLCYSAKSCLSTKSTAAGVQLLLTQVCQTSWKIYFFRKFIFTGDVWRELWLPSTNGLSSAAP